MNSSDGIDTEQCVERSSSFAQRQIHRLLEGSDCHHLRVQRIQSEDLTIELLPTGIWRSHKARKLLFIASVMFVVTVVVSRPLLVSLFQGKLPSFASTTAFIGYLVVLMFILFFCGMCFFAVLVAINWARQIATIDVVGDGLLVTQRDLFFTRVWRWDSGSIRSVWVGPSEVEVNDVPFLGLNIKGKPSAGKSNKKGVVRLFVHRADDELDWVASLLRTALSLDFAKPAQSPD